MSAGPEARHLLVVDDDDRIRELIKEYLARAGFRVSTAPDAEAARKLVGQLSFDLLVLDVMMPGEDGFTFARWLRGRPGETGRTPMLILTARGMPDDRIAGLALGADDYLGKPFEPQELVLRIEAILRRSAPRTSTIRVQLGRCWFDPGRGELWRDDLPVRLTEGEAQLLRQLASAANAPIDRFELARQTAEAAGRAVDIQVTRLRRKIEDDPKNPRYLQTVRGVGYMLGARHMKLRPPQLMRILKRRAPTSLMGRSWLIIVAPIVVMQIVVTFFFFDAYWQRVNAHLTDGLAGDVAWILQGYQDDPSKAGLKRLSDRAEQSLDLSIIYQPAGKLPTVRHFALFGIDRAMEQALSDRIDAPFWFDTTRYPAYVDIRVKVKDGVLRIIAPRDRAFATQAYSFIFYLTLATVLFMTVSVLFTRNQVRAIERLAAAADAFGKGADIPFKPYGAKEVRQAAQAFLAMKNRIQRYVDQRTTLLASVSHDLRTPLTRLKLELALAKPGKRVEAMKRDLAEMEHMINEYLAFARGEGGEALERIEVAPLLGEVSEGAVRAGAEVKVAASAGLAATVRPNAIKRALSNLVMNAAAHGDRVEVEAHATPAGGVEITIDDDGPGIPPERFEDAFTPFGRLDDARNQNEKGVGLGLAIARDVARGHGGEVTLDRSPLGGLRAVVRLPG